jgi:PPOX class probable F420-dependent enzyme
MTEPQTRPIPAAIPPGFADLVDCPPVAALTTVMPDGSPQTSAVWCDCDETYVRVSTMRGFRKEKNMRANPKVTLLCYDPRNSLRSLEIRGTVVEMTEDGAMDHLDGLSLRYAGAKPYFGRCIPEHFRETEIPVLCRIRPTRVVTLDASSDEGEPSETGTAEVAGTGEAALWPCGPGTPGVPIPESHRDLLTRPVHGILTTMEPDGQPQSSLVWVDFDGQSALVNTTRERRKGTNMAANPKVSLLVVDPRNSGRFIQIRGLAECDEERALEHLDRVTRKYTRHPCYYGYVYPVEQQARETRIIVRIQASRVTLDAIHA